MFPWPAHFVPLHSRSAVLYLWPAHSVKLHSSFTSGKLTLYRYIQEVQNHPDTSQCLIVCQRINEHLCPFFFSLISSLNINASIYFFKDQVHNKELNSEMQKSQTKVKLEFKFEFTIIELELQLIKKIFYTI